MDGGGQQWGAQRHHLLPWGVLPKPSIPRLVLQHHKTSDLSPKTSDSSPACSGLGHLLCPGCVYVPAALRGHAAKHLPALERLGRGSKELFPDKNNSSDLGAAASFPAKGEMRLVLATRGGEILAAGLPPAAFTSCSWGGGSWGRLEPGQPRPSGSSEQNLLAKGFLCQKMLFSGGGGRSYFVSRVGRAEELL